MPNLMNNTLSVSTSNTAQLEAFYNDHHLCNTYSKDFFAYKVPSRPSMRVQDWGTKWDALNIEVQEYGHETLVVTFQTAWGQPNEWLQSCSRFYSDLTFRLDYYEEGFDIQGYYKISYGTILDQHETSYTGLTDGKPTVLTNTELYIAYHMKTPTMPSRDELLKSLFTAIETGNTDKFKQILDFDIQVTKYFNFDHLPLPTNIKDEDIDVDLQSLRELMNYIETYGPFDIMMEMIKRKMINGDNIFQIQEYRYIVRYYDNLQGVPLTIEENIKLLQNDPKAYHRYFYEEQIIEYVKSVIENDDVEHLKLLLNSIPETFTRYVFCDDMTEFIYHAYEKQSWKCFMTIAAFGEKSTIHTEMQNRNLIEN